MKGDKMKQATDLMQGPGGFLAPDRDDAEDERQRQKEREYSERVEKYAADVQDICDKIDAKMAPFLKTQMAAENERARISSAVKKDFKDFEAYCGRYEPPLPHLPARPQAVAAYLCSQMDRGPAHVARQCRAISTVHTAVGVDDPTRDILVRALLRLSRENSNKEPHTAKED
jgi:hypothetical protein